MSIFERSPEGQANRNLFLGTDLIVYTEGGDGGENDVEAFDILYWRQLFDLYLPSVKVRFLPKGNQRSVLEVASTFLGTDAVGVCAAIDADYDRINAELLEDPRVIYTFGYSIENDCLIPESILRAFYILCPRCPAELDISDELADLISEFQKAVRWLALGDYLGVQSGRGAIQRWACGRYFSNRAYGSRPQFNAAMALRDVRAASERERNEARFPAEFSFDVLRYVVGHLYWEFAFKALCFFHARFSKRTRLNRDATFSVCVQSFINHLRANTTSQIAAYYEHRIQAVPVQRTA